MVTKVFSKVLFPHVAELLPLVSDLYIHLVSPPVLSDLAFCAAHPVCA